MVFTEIVYKIKSDIFPLSTYTSRHPEVKAILNHVSWDAEAKSARTLITLAGPEDRIEEALAALSPAYDRVEIVGRSKEQAIAKATARLDVLKKSGNPAAFALEYFGDAAVLEPGL